VIRDIVKSTTTAQLNNIYICIQASPVGTALTNTSYWTLIVDAVTAATSATTATTKASEAATSATNAAASYDSFDDRYLGAKSSDPSTDNDGDALATGALYFKTDGTGMKVYNGSAWKDIRPTDAQQTNIDTVAGANSNISALAASAVIADMALLATTDVIADMALLATTDVISDMNALAVSDVISDINTLATSDIVSDLNTLATSDIVSDINTLATSDIVSDLNTLATSDIVSDINTLATSDIVTDLNLLATSDFVSDLNTLATSTNVTNIANLNASGVLTNIANLNASGVVANIASVAGAVTNVNNVGGSISNVNTVASNLSAVNNFADVYRIASSAPTSSLTAGDLYFNTSTNVLNVYGASGWQNAGSSVNGTAQRYHYDISGTPTAVTGSDADGKTLAYDAGYVDVYLNGVRMSTADVTVTSGDTVTFASALTNGDEVDIVAYGTFNVASLNADNLDSGTVPVARVAGSYTGVTGTGALNAGTITSGFGNIDTGSSTITTTGAVATGALSVTDGILVSGTTPTVTIGDGGAEDTKIVFDGNAQNFYIGLDDSADDLLIGLGSTVGTTPAIAINENNKVTLPDGQMEIIIDGNYDNLTLTSTDADEYSGPNLRLYRNSSSPADNDLLGFISIDGRNDNSQDVTYARIQYLIKDASDGTEDAQIDIPVMQAGTRRSRFKSDNAETVINEDGVDLDFRVEGNGNTSLLICDAGNDRVGIGEATPDHRFHVRHNVDNNIVAKFEHSEATPEGIHITFSGGSPDGTSANFLECADTGTTRLRIQSDGDVLNHDGAYGSLSDERIKQDIRDSASQWDDIKAVKIRNFKKKDDVRQYGDNALEQIGVVAQELEAVSPKLVKENPPSKEDILSNAEFGTLYEDGDDIPQDKKIGDVKEIKEQVKSVKYSVLHMKAIKALQEAQTRIETLETKVAALEG
jgi:hypothetical protein